MQQPIVLFLTSTSFHFPLDLHALLVNEGQESKRFDSIDDFLSTPDRHTPYLAVIEVGSTDDLDRAQLAYEWCEKVQPIAACRILLLFASKNISLGERASRFGNAELVHLPMPMRNLLFKVDLQKRLLLSDQQKPKTKETELSGFSASLVDRPPKTERVLLARGPGPERGQWRQAENSPQGKVRWRWVATPHTEQEKEAEKTGVSWVAESRVAPVFEHDTESWLLDDPEGELLAFRKDKQVFSARKALKAELPAKPVEQSLGKADSPAPPLARQEFTGEKSAPAPASELRQSSSPPASAQTNFGKEAAAAPQPEAASPKQKSPNQLKIAEKFEPDSAKPAAKATKFSAETPVTSRTESSSSAPPAWNQHQSPADPKLPAAEKVKPGTSQTMSAEKTTAPSAAGQSVAKEKTAAAEETAIPEDISEKEENSTGYSVPVPTDGKEGTRSTKLGGLDDKVISARKEELARGGSEYRGAPIPGNAVADQPRPAQGAIRIQAEKFPSAPGSGAGGQKPPPSEAPADPLRPKNIGPTEEEQESRRGPAMPKATVERENLTSRLHAAKPETAHESFSASGQDQPSQEESTRAHSGRAISEETETKVKSDLRPAPLTTQIAVEGEVSRTEEEIRIKAAVQAERAASRANKSPEQEDFLKFRHFVTMTLEELADRDSSWHPVGKYRIYLSAQHRYYGVKKPEALVPLWVYEGELAPEFLDEKQAWKFYDRYPELYTSLDTLPPEVLAQVNAVAGVVERAETSSGRQPVNWNAAGVPGAQVISSPEIQPKARSGGVIGFFKRLLGIR